jgi:hypothetical protein
VLDFVVNLFTVRDPTSLHTFEVVGVDIATMSCIEINIAIMCASVPAIKPLFVKLFPKILLTNLYARSRRGYGGIKHSASRSTNRTRADTGESRHPVDVQSKLNNINSQARPEIVVTVRQDIEMRSMHAQDTDLEHGVTGGVNSRDGSDKGLVTTAWATDEYTVNESHYPPRMPMQKKNSVGSKVQAMLST